MATASIIKHPDDKVFIKPSDNTTFIKHPDDRVFIKLKIINDLPRKTPEVPSGRATLVGYIDSVDGMRSKIFTVTDSNNERYRINGEKEFLPIKIGDSFVCPVNVIHTPYGLGATMLSKPLIMMSRNIDIITRQLSEDRSIKMKLDKIYELFLEFRKLFASEKKEEITDTQLVNLLDTYAEKYVYDGDLELTMKIKSFKSSEIIRVFEWIHKQRNKRQLWLLGLNDKDIRNCHLRCTEIFAKCITNPLTLTAIPVTKCVIIAALFGKELSQEQLKDSEMVRFLQDNVTNKCWMCTPYKYMDKKFPEFKKREESIKKEYDLVVDYEAIYLRHQYLIETCIADFIVDCLQNPKPLLSVDEKKIFTIKDLTDKLSEEQRNAITTVFKSRFSIINGLAGTGKTTIIKLIVEICKHFGQPYRLCAFTGKAAARISQATGQKASTIHSLLGSLKSEGEIIVIDESSMLYDELFYNLIYRAPRSTFVIVGDNNQLQPVSAGSFLNQLLMVPQITPATMITNHRMYKIEGKVDGILLNANKIVSHNELLGPIKFEPAHNFTHINGTKEVVVEIIQNFYSHKITAENICIITPYNADIAYFNEAFQNIYSQGRNSVINNGVRWILGDRVMALENDYEIGVLNGQEGEITQVTHSGITVNFGGVEHDFNFNKLDTLSGISASDKKYIAAIDKNGDVFKGFSRGDGGDSKDGKLNINKITISYCVTTHKSQGSEYNYVVFYCPERKTTFLNKNLLYTSFTRAKCGLFIVSDLKTIIDAAAREQPPRCEKLADRINKLVPPTEEMLKKIVQASRIGGGYSDQDYEDYPCFPDE